MQNHIKIIVTGVNKTSAEIHVIDADKNKYLTAYFVLGDAAKLSQKISTVMDLYETQSVIIDKKYITGKAKEILISKNIL